MTSSCQAACSANGAPVKETANTSDGAAAPATPTRGQWAAVGSMALGVFALVTAEFLPASLLPDIAADLHVSTGVAGQTVTATAVVAAVVAPLTAFGIGQMDRRRVMLLLTALLLASNALAVAASSLGVLLVARVMLGVALGAFWSLSGALAMRLAPPGRLAWALAVILTGVSVATVCAAPIGAWMGAQWGWRSAFMAAGAVTVLSWLGQWFSLPALPARDRADLRLLGRLLADRQVRTALIAVLLMIAGQFAAFTYIRALMQDGAHLSINAVSATLLAYGVGGFLGNLVGGAMAERDERRLLIAAGVTLALVMAALLIGGRSAGLTSVAIALWGFAFAGLPIGFQTWVVRAAPDHAEAAGGLLVTAFQVAIATGAVGGGLLVDAFGVQGAPAMALVMLSLSTLLIVRRGPRRVAG